MSRLLTRNRIRKRGIAVTLGQEEQRPEELSDQDLMRLVASGDDEAFDQVYQRYKPKLRKFIQGFVRDDASTDDLLQEAFLRVYRNAEKYEPAHKLSSWVYRIAANLCLNELRHRRTHPTISLNQQVQFQLTDTESESVELYELIPDSSSAGPDEAAEFSETLREIAEALSGLSTAHRDVLTMHLYDELKYDEIAHTLRCSIGTVKSRAFYGIRALRDRLGE